MNAEVKFTVKETGDGAPYLYNEGDVHCRPLLRYFTSLRVL